MEKYKLIKQLPFENSPKIGYISEPKLKDIHYWNHNWFDPKEFPEFWELVIEKDYEILSFYAKNIEGKDDSYVDPEYIWYETHKGNNQWSRKGHITAPYKAEHIMGHKRYGIHSVKRLSDGEIFTIGDKVRIKKLQCDGSFKIDRFYFDCNNDKLLCNGKCTGNGHVSISKIEKVKNPLFTTEDGVDIYEGDKFYMHVIPFNDKNEINICRQIATDYYKTYKFKKKELLFSTKEKAEEYILMNKPCLSINDVKKAMKEGLSLEGYLTKLVKSKL